MSSPGPICHGKKCQNYQEIKPWGAGCFQPLPMGELFSSEWKRLDKMARCPGFKPKAQRRTNQTGAGGLEIVYADLPRSGLEVC